MGPVWGLATFPSGGGVSAGSGGGAYCCAVKEFCGSGGGVWLGGMTGGVLCGCLFIFLPPLISNALTAMFPTAVCLAFWAALCHAIMRAPSAIHKGNASPGLRNSIPKVVSKLVICFAPIIIPRSMQ